MEIKEYETKILKKELVAKDTYEITIKKPEGFEYVAGQYITIRLHKEITNGRGPLRAFSLSSSPKEEYLTTCFRYPKDASEFKKTIVKEENLKVTIRGPLGKFVLGKEKEVVMIAGGVGVVPFVGMIKEPHEKQKITLIYTDKEEKKIYEKELTKLEGKQFKMITRNKRVDPEFIKEHSNTKTAIYYICGTLELVQNVKQMLTRIGIEEERMKHEKFSGY